MTIFDYLLNPNGRIGQFGFFFGSVIIVCCWAIAFFVDYFSRTFLGYELLSPESRPFIGLMLVDAYVGIVLSKKRLHDRGHSWKPLILWILPIFGFLLSAYLLLAVGKEGENKYGKRTEFSSEICWFIAIVIFLTVFGVLSIPYEKLFPESISPSQSMTNV